MKCMRIALGVACALGLTIGTAYANDRWQDQSQPPLSSAYAIPDRTAFNNEMSRYKTLVSECHRAPVSERNSCLDEASLGLARPAQLANVA